MVDSNESVSVQIVLTDSVIDKLNDSASNFPEKISGIRVSINGRKDGLFDHKLSLVDHGQEDNSDQVQVINENLNLYIEGKNLNNLNGLKIDFDSNDTLANGFIFDNPNPIWDTPIALKLQKLFDEQVNPSIASHGGSINLIDIKGSSAYVEMSGGCQGCGMASVTLKQGVEVMVQEAIPEITELIDSTDHASGANPYFASEKK
jgi:Fe/S biogenesis protein NfuA